MNRGSAILELHNAKDTWTPPAIDMEMITCAVKNDTEACKCDEFLHIFQVEPYIDIL